MVLDRRCLIDVRYAPIAAKFRGAAKRRDRPTPDIERRLRFAGSCVVRCGRRRHLLGAAFKWASCKLAPREAASRYFATAMTGGSQVPSRMASSGQ